MAEGFAAFADMKTVSAKELDKKTPKKLERDDHAPPEIIALRAECNILMEYEHYEDALEKIDELIKKRPTVSRFWERKAMCLDELEQSSDAMKCIDKAIELDPKDPENYDSKAIILAGIGKLQEALEHDEKAIELDPKNDKFWHNKGADLEDLGKLDEAMKCFDKAIELDPKDSHNYYSKANLLQTLERWDEAVENYDKMLEIDDKDTQAITWKAIILSRVKEEHEKAGKLFLKAVELEPDEYSWRNLGLSLMVQGKNEESLKYFDLLLKEIPNDPGALFGKSCALRHLKKWDEAAKYNEEFIKNGPVYYGAYHNRAEILLKRGKLEGALDAINTALGILETRVSYEEKGYILEEMGKKDEAEECFRKAKQFPEIKQMGEEPI